MKLILGSQSPRRKEILGYFSFPFEQVSSNFDESLVPFEGDPVHYVSNISKGKADALFETNPQDIILTADTIVYQDGIVYGKPADDTQVFNFLQQLSGKWHSVYTGLTLRQGNAHYQEFEETRVLFNSLTPDQIRLYFQQMGYEDKSGGYTIEKKGSLIVKRMEGCFYNVMGLPINALQKLLKNVNIDLWDYLQ